MGAGRPTDVERLPIRHICRDRLGLRAGGGVRPPLCRSLPSPPVAIRSGARERLRELPLAFD